MDSDGKHLLFSGRYQAKPPRHPSEPKNAVVVMPECPRNGSSRHHVQVPVAAQDKYRHLSLTFSSFLLYSAGPGSECDWPHHSQFRTGICVLPGHKQASQPSPHPFPGDRGLPGLPGTVLGVRTQRWRGLVPGVDRLEVIAVVCGLATIGNS